MTIKLHVTRGVLGLVGTEVDDIAREATKNLQPHLNELNIPLAQLPYHITLLTKTELRGVPQKKLVNLHPDTRHIFPAGIGGNPNSGVLFVVIIWAAGQQLRKQLGLSPKQFHITLTEKDDHDIDKGIDSLLPGQFSDSPPADFLDHLAFTLHVLSQPLKAQRYCIELILLHPNSHRGYIRLGDAALQGGQHKLAMLSYACAYQRTDNDKVKDYCTKKILDCSRETEWGHVFLESELAQLPQDIVVSLFEPWSSDLRTRLSDIQQIPTLCLEQKQNLYIPATQHKEAEPFQRLPRWFRWLVPFRIAIMSTPKNEADIAALAGPYLGIRHVLTLTEEEPLQRHWFHEKHIKNTFLPVVNRCSPSIEQMDVVMRLVQDESNLPFLIHCGGGKGRAGTIAACYLTAYGYNPPMGNLARPEMAAVDAITTLRTMRPGSIETTPQETFVATWCSTIWKRQCILPDLPPEPPSCPLEIEGHLDSEINLLILVGLPGAGKSWFSSALLARNPKAWTRISQDETGSRTSCETAIGRRDNQRVILDRCNTTASDRRSWLALAATWATAPLCVWFDYEAELCTARAQMRPDHPTLSPGNRVRNAVEHMRKTFDRPSVEEGFRAVTIVRSFTAAMEVVDRLSPPITIYKYPRTPHLLDLGASTADDVHSDITHLPIGLGTAVITEKVDGANMGFSLSADRSKIIVQNRSHYVNPTTHQQFKKLGLWMDNHDAELRKVLDRDEYSAERYILFGEWLYATHSIPYTNLPDRFMAFDLYDRSTDIFVDRKTLANLLSDTSIHLVPIIHQGSMPSEGDLRAMVERRSLFWDGPVEGVYVKVDRDGCVVARGKVVRGDFICGNQHWTKGHLRVNGLVAS